ncbi:MAG: VPGUxxT family thioredoxin-like (seleno)protein, type 2 [Verrucomicrobiota bacterium]
MQRILTLTFSLFVAAGTLVAEKHPELGDVEWLRNYDQAVKESAESEKPLLILFQEVPGCEGCVIFGQDTLSHPLVVDAIENDFVPLAIRNNISTGHDREILERFEEPAWNYQVMRFLDTKGGDIIPRKDRVWSIAGTAERMIQALEVAKRPVPDYLHSIVLSQPEAPLKTAVFSMYCFWDGEAKLGGIEGVAETEAGWLDGREVVRLRFDPAVIAWPELVRTAQSHGCAKHVYAPDAESLRETPAAINSHAELLIPKAYRKALASDQKRHLQFSSLKNLPLNPVQLTKVNAALANKDQAAIERWLSPSQRKSLQ